MADLIFAFDQIEMNELVKNSDNADLKIAIVFAKDPRDQKGKFFLAAHEVTATSATAKVAVGCPVPPGWNKIIPLLTQTQVISSPSFTLKATSKGELENLAAKEEDQLFATLKGVSGNQLPRAAKLIFKGKQGKDVDTTID